MYSEMTGCSFITFHSSSSSGPGLWRIRSGIPILPMSWRRAPISIASRSPPEKPSLEEPRQRTLGVTDQLPAIVCARGKTAGELEEILQILVSGCELLVRAAQLVVRRANLLDRLPRAADVLADRAHHHHRRQRER